ncbi:MAG: response regulator [Candidatus Omnitrophota bacterium]|nr:response regulator [Candidatus Omnitrophota bacterium]
MEKKRILVLDDEVNITSMIKTRLEYTGEYEVRTLSDAKNIVSEVRTFKPDCILLDLLMPEIGGIEVCQMLNNDPLGITIPIIVISALDKNVDKIKAYKLGVVDYLTKPFEAKALLYAVEKAVKSRQPK